MIPHHVTSSRAKAALLGLALMPATTSAQARVPYLDPAQPVERRVDDLLGRMTLEGKVAQMLCLWQGKRAITDRDGRFDPARARGVHQVLAPVVDVARDPRWGRIEETYGEDPYLAARMGVAAVRGFQGTEARIGPSHVLATLKHMTGHGQPESGTNVGPAPYGERTLRDVFLYPFAVVIKEAGARSVMPSYNEVDGIPSHANRWLLHDVLRGGWGFNAVA